LTGVQAGLIRALTPTYTVPGAGGWRWFEAIWNGFSLSYEEKKKNREITTVYASVNGRIHSILL
jgi:hypothetical protein